MGYDIYINGIKADIKDFIEMRLNISLGSKWVAKMHGKRIDYFLD